jgi:hypothetical protein
MTKKKHLSPREEYRISERERVNAAEPLANRFPDITSLAIQLTFKNHDNSSKGSTIRYNINLKNAKTILRFDCPNSECVYGDFDLSKELSTAAIQHHRIVKGESSCQGWASRHCIDTRRCDYHLSYQIELAYSASDPAPSAH